MRSLEGFDPYDALRGTRVPGFVSGNARLRQIAIQLRRRSPIDLAPVYGVRPFVMAKAVAGFLAGQARRSYAAGSAAEDLPAAESLVEALFAAEGNLGGGAWGYEFDVQTRWGYYPVGSANLIATVFVGTALLEAGRVFGCSDWVDSGLESAHFVLGEFFDQGDSEGAVFRYTSNTRRIVHNANLLGAGLLATAARATHDDSLIDAVHRAVSLSLAAQEPSGRWPYGAGPGLQWADNFHTAYNLAALLQVSPLGIPGVEESISRGLVYWVDRFFGPNGEPLYFDDKPYPLDIHSGATAVDVAGRLALAGYETDGVGERCASWIRTHLIGEDGRTRCGVHRWYTDHRSFVRWGDAHWDAAQGTEALAAAGVAYPVWPQVVAK